MIRLQLIEQKKLFFLCILLLLIAGCSQKNKSHTPEKLSLHYDNEFTIGGEENDKNSYLFASPTEIHTDDSGNIYVSDQKSSQIRMFDSGGTYLRSIGNKGKGPGEFLDISNFLITHSHKLIVFDVTNKRITRFSQKGKLLSTIGPHDEMMVWPKQSAKIDSNHFLILRELSKLKDVKFAKQNKERHSNIFHLFNDSLTRRNTSFGNVDTVMNTESKFDRLFSTNINTGYFFLSEEHKIWYSPGIYNGHIFRFDKGNDGWSLAKSFPGKVFPQHTVAHTASHSSLQGIITFTTFTGGGPYSGRVNSESLGFFQLKDGRLIHFTSQIRHEKRLVIVEIFTPKGALKGVGTLNQFTTKIKQRSMIGPIWKDQNDRFYFVDKRKKPSIKVGRIAGI